MLNDVDETLRQYLIADVPVERGEVDISFERPTREWSGRLSKPTLNLFMFDIRERTGYRDDTPQAVRLPTGAVSQSLPARRVDLSYLVTAWTREPRIPTQAPTGSTPSCSAATATFERCPASRAIFLISTCPL